MLELALYILDIVQNSIRAKASEIRITITENITDNQFIIEIADNGCGMSDEMLEVVENPFFTTRTTRKVGLGISLLKQNTEQTNGFLKIQSEEGKGTYLKAVFTHDHFDRPILGDIAGTMTLLMAANPKIHFIYKHKTQNGTYRFCTNEIADELDGVSIANPDIQKALKELINENLKEIKATIN